MFYYWLIPIIVVALLTVLALAYSTKRKRKTLPEGRNTEAVKRGRYINK